MAALTFLQPAISSSCVTSLSAISSRSAFKSASSFSRPSLVSASAAILASSSAILSSRSLMSRWYFDLCQYFGHKFLKNQAAFDSLPAACSCAVSSIGSVLSKKPSMVSAGIL